MRFQKFKNKVVDLKGRKPIWFGLEGDAPASDSEIAVVESTLRLKLPKSYIEFVREFGGGYFAFGNVFSVSASSDWSIMRRNESLEITNFLAVSDNECGDYFGFQIVNGHCQDPVHFWDHEKPDSIILTEYRDLFEFLDATALTPS